MLGLLPAWGKEDEMSAGLVLKVQILTEKYDDVIWNIGCHLQIYIFNSNYKEIRNLIPMENNSFGRKNLKSMLCSNGKL